MLAKCNECPACLAEAIGNFPLPGEKRTPCPPQMLRTSNGHDSDGDRGSVLLALQRMGEASPSGIAAELGIKRQRVYRALDRLEGHGAYKVGRGLWRFASSSGF